MEYMLFAICILLLIISYFFKKDIFHPACLLPLTYSFSIFCAILNKKNWNMILSSKTFYIISIGVFFFTITCLLVDTKSKNKRENFQNAKVIRYSKELMFFLFIIQFTVTILFFIWLFKNIGGGISAIVSNSSLITNFRYAMSFDNEISYPQYISQGIKFTKAFITIFSYIEVHNMILSKMQKEKYKINCLLFISIFLFITQTLLSGSRSDIIIYLISLVGMIFIVKSYYSKKFGTKLGRNFIKIVLLVISILFLFSYTRGIIGRTSDESTFDYVTRYFGGSIELLDLYTKNPISKSDIWGKETFLGINKFLSQLGIIDFNDNIHLEFRTVNGISLGNVYTAFRRYYQDFGYVGLIMLNIIYGFIMGIYYNNIKNSESISKISIKFIFYFMILHAVILSPFSDFFYSTILSINYLNIFIYMVFIKYILTKIS